uniref:BHLH domain-containing protein n=1 Tax=Oryza brachyantha TaxID=4533 RepID=J3LDN6_ORYBR
MAKEGTSNGGAPPAANVNSMVSGGDNNNEGTGDSQAGNLQPAADKGKGVDEGGSNGKSTATAAAAAASSTNGRAAGGGGGRSRERMHIFAERERRRKIKNMFTDLRELVPSLTSKADKASIVGEAISFIRGLEETVTDLERRKRERDSLTA